MKKFVSKSLLALVGASVLFLPTLTAKVTLSQTPNTSSPVSGTPLRYLAINVGNVSNECWESKLCDPEVVKHLKKYISDWKPDVIMFSEVYREAMLKSPIPVGQDPSKPTTVAGPILPEGYDGMCGKSQNPDTSPASWYAENASHEHECVAWKTSRLTLAPGTVPGSPKSAYGIFDPGDQLVGDVFVPGAVPDTLRCHYDFTGFRVKLVLEKKVPITAVAIHPQSGNYNGQPDCRKKEIGRYWQRLVADNPNVIIGGDWNTEDDKVIRYQMPPNFKVNYSHGNHWEVAPGTNKFIATHPDEFTAVYKVVLPGSGIHLENQFDHAFSNFGEPCRNCGTFYGTPDLIWGSALGGSSLDGPAPDGHPRADGGNGMDHRQILVDMVISE